MCIILDILPGAKIPAKDLEIACEIDKHGYGIAWVEGKQLKVIRSIKDNDPKDVADQLQRLNNKHLFVHLRHATVGKVNLPNSHPFMVLSKKRHGLEVGMMHNGTLYEYKPAQGNDVDSDTLVFSQRFVTPLLSRFISHTGPKGLFADALLPYILKKEAGFTSVVLFFDNLGNSLIINKDKGKQYDGYWASNDHLEDKYHTRRSNNPTYSNHSTHHYSGSNWWDQGDELPWEEVTKPEKIQPLTSWEQDLKEYDAARTCVVSEKLGMECVKLGEELRAAKQWANSVMVNGQVYTDLKQLKPTFSEMAGVEPEKVGRLTEEDLLDMVKNFPAASARLIIELLHNASVYQERIKNQASHIGTLEREAAI